MKLQIIAILLILATLPLNSCDSGYVCSSGNKNITVDNNSARRISVVRVLASSNHTTWLPLGDIEPFQFKTFLVPPFDIVQTADPNNTQIYKELLVDGCIQNQYLVYED